MIIDIAKTAIGLIVLILIYGYAAESEAMTFCEWSVEIGATDTDEYREVCE